MVMVTVMVQVRVRVRVGVRDLGFMTKQDITMPYLTSVNSFYCLH